MGRKGCSQFDHTYPYVFIHCEITKNDESVIEPILETRIIGETYDVDTFSKYGHFSGPDNRIFKKMQPFYRV